MRFLLSRDIYQESSQEPPCRHPTCAKLHLCPNSFLKAADTDSGGHPRIFLRSPKERHCLQSATTLPAKVRRPIYRFGIPTVRSKVAGKHQPLAVPHFPSAGDFPGLPDRLPYFLSCTATHPLYLLYYFPYKQDRDIHLQDPDSFLTVAFLQTDSKDSENRYNHCNPHSRKHPAPRLLPPVSTPPDKLPCQCCGELSGSLPPKRFPDHKKTFHPHRCYTSHPILRCIRCQAPALHWIYFSVFGPSCRFPRAGFDIHHPMPVSLFSVRDKSPSKRLETARALLRDRVSPAHV